MVIRDSRERELHGLFGSAGCGRGVMPILRTAVADGRQGGSAVFVERESRPPVNGTEVWSEDAFFAHPGPRFFNVAIADPRLRRKVVERCLATGSRPISIVDPSFVIYDENEIGPGAIICASCIVTSNVRIGAYFHMNLFSYVEHDCVIGDYVTFAPGVRCNGNIHIGDHAYIGSGAIIRQGTPDRPLVIGAGAVVGMGAVVTRDVPPDTTVVGNPARVSTRRG